MIQFREPKRVRWISDDGKYLYVDGSNTGIPAAEVSVEEAPAPPKQLRRIKMPPSEEGSNMRQDVFNLPEGGDVILSWPESITAESLEDLKSWLETAQRKIGRFIKLQESQKDESPE